jgi:hypothetical protein
MKRALYFPWSKIGWFLVGCAGLPLIQVAFSSWRFETIVSDWRARTKSAVLSHEGLSHFKDRVKDIAEPDWQMDGKSACVHDRRHCSSLIGSSSVTVLIDVDDKNRITQAQVMPTTVTF